MKVHCAELPDPVDGILADIRKAYQIARLEAATPKPAPERVGLTPCPNCGRIDGWHKAEGHPPSLVGDSRKIVWLTDGDMDWWGVRAYGNRGGTDYDSDYGWMNNGAKESATVLFWKEGPHNPHYPAPVSEADSLIHSLRERVEELEAALNNSKLPKMYVWHGRGKWLAMAHAFSVQEARDLLLEETGTTDGSCPVRGAAVEQIRSVGPTIFYSSNAEFALTDSGELEEADAYSETLKGRITELESQLSALQWVEVTPESETPQEGESVLVEVLDDNSHIGGDRRVYFDVWEYAPNNRYWYGDPHQCVLRWKRIIPPSPTAQLKALHPNTEDAADQDAND